MTKVCASCATDFVVGQGKRTDAVYCTDACRRRAKRKRHPEHEATYYRKHKARIIAHMSEYQKANRPMYRDIKVAAHWRNRDRRLAQHREWVANNRATFIAGLRRYPERIAARSAVAGAVRTGVLARAATQSCFDCGGPAAQHDHYLGYGREHWLDVQPVCRRCHGARDRARGEHRRAA